MKLESLNLERFLEQREKSWFAKEVYFINGFYNPYSALIATLYGFVLDEQQRHKLIAALLEMDLALATPVEDPLYRKITEIGGREEYAIRALIENLDFWLFRIETPKRLACSMLTCAELYMPQERYRVV